ncbi:MAG: amidase [Alphaproteobacteria bacterium]|nr:amidase [Alphaproteobacteria bacterium]
MTELNELSALAARQGLQQKRFSAEELWAACDRRIGLREATIGAFIHYDAATARRQAQACDAGQQAGALHGLPFGVKDIIDTTDAPTGYGSRIYVGHRPAWDAGVVAAIRLAGAVVMGKTVTTEFAYRTAGKTANPHNPAHSPGGSSSGSAAAVADHMLPLAFGSQTGGSVIRPAAYCGVVGYKSSFGAWTLAGVKPMCHSLDSLGVFARQVADLPLVRAALAGGPDKIAALERPPRVGLCRTFDWPKVETCMQSALEAAGQTLARNGAEVRDLPLPGAFDGLGYAHATIMTYEMARNYAFEGARHREKLSPPLAQTIDDGWKVPLPDYLEAQALAKRCRAQLDEICQEYDVLLAPGAPGEAPEGLHATGDPVMNRSWTLLHVPAVNLPGYKGPRGLPLGLQAIRPQGDDDRLLQVAAWMEQRIR